MNCARREVYTVHVNSRSVQTPQTDSNFVGYIDIPLRNVVKAELLMASIAPNSNTVGVVHLYVQELISKFNLRAPISTAVATSNTVTTIGSSTGTLSNVAFINNAFATLPYGPESKLDATPGRLVFNRESNFPTDVEYIEPIRYINRLTIQLYDSLGVPLVTSSNSYLTFRFECAKDNVCKY